MSSYSKYKNSGVELIGDIPYHWSIKKISHAFNIIGSGTTPPSGNQEYYENGIYPWLQTGDLNDGHIDSTSKKITEKAIKEFSTLRFYPEGSLVIAMYGATIGKTAILNFKTTTNQACCVLADGVHFYPEFAFYWFQANKSNVINLASGGGQPNISQEVVRTLKLPCPPLNEQLQIINFLKKKTEEIDLLVTNKLNLISLLQEERTALINHSITKGIDQNFKMKNSGVEGIGEVPQHWSLVRLKYLSLIKYGLGQPPRQKSDGLPIIRATNVKRGKISDIDLIFVDPDDVPYDRDPVLRTDDIVVVRSGAYTADSAIVPEKYDGAITGYDLVLRCINADAKFIAYSLLAEYVLVNQLIPLSLRAAQPHLNREELGETCIVLPGIEEQHRIVEFLNSKLNKLDQSIAKIKIEIGLLKEYRTSLINEVVTGKLTVPMSESKNLNTNQLEKI